MPGSVKIVPVEVWRRIGDFLTSPFDLVNLASISPQALFAAADLTRYPWVKVHSSEFRLVDVIGFASPIQEITGETEVIEKYYLQLGRANFAVVMDGRHVIVDLVQVRKGERCVICRAIF